MNIGSTKEISVIIPVFNAQDTLPYCLDSILNQTIQDYEIIIINDGSTDDSQEIIEKYKDKYPDKFRVYKQKNVGVAITRNRGIEYAKGNYLFFIDNDDYIDKDYFETFLKKIKNSGKEMIIGGYRRVDMVNGYKIKERRPKEKQYSKYMFLAPWGKIYRRESIQKKDITFLDFPVGEDLYFSVIAGLKLSYEITQYVGYNWVYNINSVSNTKQKRADNLNNVVPLYKEINKKVMGIELSEDEKILLQYFYIKTAIYYILLSGRGSNSKQIVKKSEEIFTWINSKYEQYRKNKYLGLLKPKGQDFSTRVIVSLYLILRKVKLEKLFLNIYSKI